MSIVHVGFPRTGTSSLQRHLFPQLKNVRYFDHKQDEHKLETLRAMASRDPIHINDSQLKAQLKLDDFDLWSFERLIGAPEIGFKDHTSLLKLLERTFTEPRIIMTIRKQSEMSRSLYLIYLLRGGRLSIERFLGYSDSSVSYGGPYIGRGEASGLEKIFSPHSLNFNAFYRSYVEAFGPQNVLVLPLEMGLLDFDLYRSLIEKFTGGKLYLSKFPGQRDVGNWYKSRVVRMVRLLNVLSYSEDNPIGVFKRKVGRINMLRIHRLVRFAGGSNVMSTDLRDAIQDAHSDSNRLLAEGMGVDLSEYGYY